MFDLMQALMARELSADRLRDAEQRHLRRDARRHVLEAHRREVERVRASVLLLPRNAKVPDDAREA